MRCSQSCEVFHHVPSARPKQYDIGLVKASTGGCGFLFPSIPRCLGSTIGNFSKFHRIFSISMSFDLLRLKFV